MQKILEVGFCPSCEPVEQGVEVNHKTCERYLKGLQKRWPNAKFRIKNVMVWKDSEPYHTIILDYLFTDVQENNLARHIEGNLPETWSEIEEN